MLMRHKYAMSIGVAIAVMLFIVVTQVWDRFVELHTHYDNIVVKKETKRTPAELADRKLRLLQEKKSLEAELHRTGANDDRSQSGIVELLTKDAGSHGMHLISLTPAETDTAAGNNKPFSFRMNVAGTYHAAGSFLNSIETGPVPIEIRNVSMASKSLSSPNLEVEICVVVSMSGHGE